MRKKIDYWSYLFRYTIKLRYLNWTYIQKNKAEILFLLLNIFLFLASSYKGLTSLILPEHANKSPLVFLSEWILSYNTGVLILTLLTLLSKARPIYLNYGKKKMILAHGLTTPDPNRNYEEVEPPPGYLEIEHTFLQIASDGKIGEFKDTIYFSPKINKYLINSEKIKLIITRKDLEIQKVIFDRFDKLKLFFKLKFKNSKGKKLFNENKLCLSEDLLVGKPVQCHKGTYFDTMLTNDLAGCYIANRNSTKPFVDLQIELPITRRQGYKNSFKPISDTLLNNNMGGSTIAFTKDNKMVFWTQGGISQFSEGLIAPTGSGSCDYEDITDNDFIKTIKKTMERELLEESTQDVNYENIVETRIIGYFRWQKRGGLPQFVGITKINLNKKELKANPKELVIEDDFINDNLVQEFSPSESGMQDILHYLKTRCEIKNLSVPLKYNLIALIDYIENYPDKAKEFFLPDLMD